ncbi:CPBP family intramembrane glutamic endopeptidase [Planctomycetes bacterium K23_9]|uniref:CAAX amino terminal protease self-immunity n=1 Tax=Stieleria marina TaxID=1930275 RepID=A0A517P2Y3_9BACT|nr:CAAX amino terminal protease self- immunity [Planctomycetes bacterium K23_9]
MSNPYESPRSGNEDGDPTNGEAENPPLSEQIAPHQDSAALKPRVWPLFPLALVEMVFASLLQGVVILFVLFVIREPGQSIVEAAGTLPTRIYDARIFTTLIVCSGVSMMLGGYWFGSISARHRDCSLTDRLGLTLPQLSTVSWGVLAIGSIPVLLLAVGAVIAIEQVIPGDQSVLALYKNISDGWAIVFIIAIGVFPGVGEELFFRGFLQRRFLQRFRPAVAIGITSVIFGLAHVTPHGIALATIIGVWLGWIAYRTNSIWPGALIHAFINSGWNVYQVGRFQWGIPTIPPVWFQVVGGIIALIAFGWASKVIASQRLPAADSSVSVQRWPRLVATGESKAS